MSFGFKGVISAFCRRANQRPAAFKNGVQFLVNVIGCKVPGDYTGHILKRFLTTKFNNMKSILFFLALFLATARPASAQAIVKVGTVAQVRLDKVTIPGYGRHEMYFVEAIVEGKTQLLLVDGKCPVRAGSKIRVFEGYDVPRYVLVDGSGARWYCYMDKYLKR